MPDLSSLRPMKATTAREVPQGSGWIGEPKFDGIRMLARVENGAAHLVTRNGNERTGDFPAVAAAIKELAGNGSLVLDGEVVAMREGKPARFQTLQRRHLEDHEGENAFAVFDLVHSGGKDFTGKPWRERRSALETLLKGVASPNLLLSPYRGDLDALLTEARERGEEGIIVKRTDSAYRPGKRSDAWRKLKLEYEQEFVIGGWTPPQRSRPHLGALLVGYYEGEDLVYAGKVGTGFTHEDLKELRGSLGQRKRKTSPFATPPKVKDAHWARPDLVAQVRFTEWTLEGRLRHPAFLGLREDKDPQEVVREPESLAGG